MKKSKETEELRYLVRKYGPAKAIAIWLKHHPEEEDQLIQSILKDAEKEGLSEEEKERLKAIIKVNLLFLGYIAAESKK